MHSRADRYEYHLGFHRRVTILGDSIGPTGKSVNRHGKNVERETESLASTYTDVQTTVILPIQVA